jgi:Fur family peroxide stress response transcriptional regulator
MEGNSERDFIATLRDRGLQVTYQRLAIYQALCHAMEHPSAEVIYQQVRKRFPMISLGTVYKTLERFFDVGLVHKVSPVSEVARYDAKLSPHHHLICMRCHSIEDIEDPILDREVSLPDGCRFHVLRHQVILQGYCHECQAGLEDPIPKNN